MKKLFSYLCLMLLLVIPLKLLAVEAGVKLFMQDGQLKSHPVRVMVEKDFEDSITPVLQLSRLGLNDISETVKHSEITPMLVARNQKMSMLDNGVKREVSGTLLLFDLSAYDTKNYWPVIRFIPTLKWQETVNDKVVERYIVGSNEIHLGNPLPAFMWTVAIILALLLLIAYFAKADDSRLLNLICEKNGRLSLSRTQIAVWTVAIGAIVVGFGMVKFEVPNIPESLVVLMGLSLVTGGISYVNTVKPIATQNQGELSFNEGKTIDAAPVKLQLSDLIRDNSAEGAGRVSLVRAQMIFWTVLTLFLFISKSILNGELWQVPWANVALMGMSQASYLAPKVAAQFKTNK